MWRQGRGSRQKSPPAIPEASVPGQSFAMSKEKHTRWGHGRMHYPKQRLLLNLSQKWPVWPDAPLFSRKVGIGNPLFKLYNLTVLKIKVKVLVTQLFPALGNPMDKACHLLCPWDSPGKNTGVDCHSLLQGIFPTEGLNPGLLHCRQSLYHLSHQGTEFNYTNKIKTTTSDFMNILRLRAHIFPKIW